MKHTMYAATLVLTAILASAQVTPAQSLTRVSDDDESVLAVEAEDQQLLAAALLRSYAERVNSLLRDLAQRLQTISSRAAADELSPEQSERLKLAAARATIARLETTSAVYESQLAPIEDEDDFT